MIIYQLLENYQATDSDGWQHWVNTTSHGFYQSKTTPEALIPMLCKERADKYYELNPELHSNQEFLDEVERRRHNILILNDDLYSTGDGIGEYPFFFLKDVIVLP